MAARTTAVISFAICFIFGVGCSWRGAVANGGSWGGCVDNGSSCSIPSAKKKAPAKRGEGWYPECGLKESESTTVPCHTDLQIAKFLLWNSLRFTLLWVPRFHLTVPNLPIALMLVVSQFQFWRSSRMEGGEI
jgi:hypothetical protein